MMNKKVTIVLATYNGELYLKEQLDSIINQSFSDYQLLIGDDCSSDNTVNIIKEYQLKYKNIYLICNSKRLGVVSNFENLIKQVKHGYIALCDQDDIWYEDKLYEAMNILENENNKNLPMLFHSDLEAIDRKNIKLYDSFFKKRGYAFPKKKSIDILLGRSGVMGNTIVFNQALKNKILPFPEGLIVHDYWIALVNEFMGKRITFPNPLVKYRIHQNNTSKTFRGSSISLMRKNIVLPYHNIQREKVLEEFKKRFKIRDKELEIVDIFLDYLYFKKNKLSLILSIFPYDFFRIGLSYKLKLYGAILWKK